MNKSKQKILAILLVALLAMTAVALIACSKQHSVVFDANGGSFAQGKTFAQRVDDGAKIVEPISPTRGGYVFAGWAKSKDGNDYWNFDTDTVTKNIVLFAQWSQSSGGIESVDGATITDKEIKMYVDNDVQSVNLVDKVHCNAGYSWKLYADQFGLIELAAKVAPIDSGENVYYIVVTSSDGNSVTTYTLTIYRHHSISIRYYDGSNLLFVDTSRTGEQYEANYKPTIIGYVFNKWVDAQGNTFTADTLWESLNLYADKTANKYTVTLDENGGNELDKKEFEISYGSAFTLPIPSRIGYSFAGWYVNNTQITDASGKSTTPWSIPEQTQLNAHWQANDYDVIVSLNDTEAGSVLGDGKHAFDSSVTVSSITNSGYTWVGWFDGDELLTRNHSYTFTMGLGTSLTAKWSKVTLTTNNSAAGTVSELTETYEVGDSVTVTAFTNSGYTWVGWFQGDSKLTDSLTHTFAMTDSDITYTARWSKASFTYDASAGTVSALDGKYKVGDSVTISATAFVGYEFLGWFDGDELIHGGVSYTFAMTEFDVTYTVKWKVRDDLELFIFTATADTCTVIGINDKTVTEISVPDCVTAISKGAFSGCGNLQSLTLPFIGAYKTYQQSDYLYPFGYIFGNRYFVGSEYTEQYYRTASGTKQSREGYYIPEKLTTVTVLGGEIPFSAFRDCAHLTTVNLPADLTALGESAFPYCTALATVELPEGLKEIGSNAFSNSGLQTISIPSSVTVIGEYAFYNVQSLTEVTFASGSKLREIGESAFMYDANLSGIDLPNGLLTLGGYVFKESGLTTIQLPNSLQSIGNLCFEKCMSLQQVSVSENIKSLGESPFSGCENITTVFWSVKQCEYSSGGVFNSCVNLTTVTFGNGVTQIPDAMFNNCKKLANVTLPDSLVTIGENAFYKCFALDSIVIPSSVRLIDRFAFSNTGLTQITFNDGIQEIGVSAFYNCEQLSSVSMPDSVTTLGASAFALCAALTEVILPNHLTTIPSNCFNKSGLTRIEIPADVATIGKYAFNRCTSLTELTFAANSKIKTIEEDAFYYAKLSRVELPDGIETLVDNAFRASGLEEIVVPASMKQIGWAAFSGNSNLRTVHWHPFDCTLGGSIFSGCGNFQVVFYGQTEIPAYLFAESKITEYTVPEGITSIGSNAFAGCTSLSLITLPESLTNVSSSAFSKATALYQINWNAIALAGASFKDCTSLTKVVFGDKVTKLPYSVFYGCTGIKQITLPDTLTEISANAFYGCTGLTEITIPASVTAIRYSFQNCTNLKSVIFQNPEGWSAEENSLSIFRDDRTFSSLELSDRELAAKYLTSNYANYIWQREDV